MIIFYVFKKTALRQIQKVFQLHGMMGQGQIIYGWDNEHSF